MDIALIIMTAISHNDTMISLIWANKIIVDSLSMDNWLGSNYNSITTQQQHNDIS